MSRQERILTTLKKAFPFTYLVVENESHQHQVPEGAELHFKVIGVSETFSGLPLLARHRLLNQCLDPEFKSGMHALSLHLYTPEEWETRANKTRNSPECVKKTKKS